MKRPFYFRPRRVHHPTKGKCARRGRFLCPTIDGAFSLHCHFLAVGVCPVSFCRFASWLSFFVPPRLIGFLLMLLLVRPRSPSLRSCATCFPPPFLSFTPCSLPGNRWCFGRRKNAFAPPPSRARVMRPRVPCFEIIAFTSSPNAHNLLIWSALR